MKYQVIIERAVLKQIKHFDKKTQLKILAAAEKLGENPRPHGYKKLIGGEGFYRVHVGDYRLIYSIDDDVLIVSVLRAARRDESTYR